MLTKLNKIAYLAIESLVVPIAEVIPKLLKSEGKKINRVLDKSFRYVGKKIGCSCHYKDVICIWQH